MGWNLETPTWCSPDWDDSDEVEGRVAGALWDIYDSQDDGYDTFSDGFTQIWDIVETTTCDTFREFWDAWNTSGYPKQPALLAIFQNTIEYRGEGDVNFDGKVDIVDLVLVIRGHGSYKGQPNWDKRRDVNNDDKVDIEDIVIVRNSYGNYYDC